MFTGNFQQTASLPKFLTGPASPQHGAEEEALLFKHLQNQLVHQFEVAFPDMLAAKTVVIIPSLTLDQEILQKIDGIVHYEERMLCLLMLLRMPRTQVIYVTSVPIDSIVIDYYLHLLPGITGYHARQRLTLLSCYDSSPIPLTQKILNRPRLIERIRRHIQTDHAVHMACFNVTPLERTLSVALNIPIYGCDPDLFSLGNKSNGRKLFRDCGLRVPNGFEDLRNETEIAEALTALKLQHPNLRKAVVKMNEGFSGEGNAIFRYPGNLLREEITPQFMLHLLSNQLNVVAKDLSYTTYMQKFTEMGGIVEEFVEGVIVTSPSVQCRINPSGGCDVISTHDQVLGGDGHQVFLGAYFPAKEAYASELAAIAMPLCEALRDKGVIGRFGIDFLSKRNAQGKWQHYAIEINMRKGGTTHPFLMLNFLTDGTYHADTGKYTIKTGQERFYFSTDNLVDPCFKGLTPHDLIEIAMDNELMFNGASQEGVMFHMIGALSQYGKLGVVSIGKTPQDARNYYDRTKEVLHANCS
jgi:PGM1 C-terminal domain